MTSVLRPSVLGLGCVLLLTTLTTVCAQAQIELEPLSPNLSPALTTDPQTEPITTLAIDLLAPQRPYIFDPTGSSVATNALNPAIYSSTFSLSLVQTDTQIRDSSQAGHLSPYAATAARLGLTNSGSDDSASQVTPTISNGSFHGALPGDDEEEGSGTGADNPYQSSWGTSSSFGAQSDQGSWGTKRLNVNRLGSKQPESFAASPGLNGEGSTAANSTGSSAGNQGTYLAANSNGYSTGSSAGYSSRSSSRYSSDKSANSPTPRYGDSNLNSSGYAATGPRTRHSDSESAPGELTSVDTTTDAAMNSGTAGATNGTPKDKNQSSPTDALAFFPEAAYAPSPLGESPFSSPSGVGQLHFLNPNVFAATSQGRLISVTEAGNADPTRDSLRQAFVGRHTLATSTSHYGLATHPAAGKLKTGMDDKLSTRKRTHLSTGIPNSENP